MLSSLNSPEPEGFAVLYNCKKLHLIFVLESRQLKHVSVTNSTALYKCNSI